MSIPNNNLTIWLFLYFIASELGDCQTLYSLSLSELSNNISIQDISVHTNKGLIQARCGTPISVGLNLCVHILATVDFLQSNGFSDADFPRLAFLCPQIFSSTFETTDIAPIFDFLALELPASVQQSRGLILRCPKILFSDVEFWLRPTLRFLRQVGIQDLSHPSNLNAHLLNTRVPVPSLGFQKAWLSMGFLPFQNTFKLQRWWRWWRWRRWWWWLRRWRW